MPSQDTTSGIPVTHALNGIGYRLLELPPELVEGGGPWSLESDSAGLARLRTTQGKVYALRQKNTSNAMILLSATGAVSEDSPQAGFAAVATLHETVELVEEKGAAVDAAAKGGKADDAKAAADAGKSAAAPARGRWHEKFGRTR